MHSSNLKRWPAEVLSDQKPDFKTVSAAVISFEAHLTIKGGAMNTPRHSRTKEARNNQHSVNVSEQMLALRRRLFETQRRLNKAQDAPEGVLRQTNNRNRAHRTTEPEISEFCKS